MNSSDRTDRYCIIGAGASGLAVAKNFVQRGIAFDCLEREPDIGGLWNFATESGIVYETTHLVSSISSTGFDDLPMLDEDYPEYPSHERVLGYFRDVVRTFGLAPHIELGKVITKVAPRGDKLWEVAVAGEAEPRLYRGVVVASGHHDAPRMPAYPGTFTGETLHSRRYKSPKQVRDRRVLVVGCGNSAADIVSDAVHGRSKVFLSIRRGYWFVPKFIMGFPTGDVLSTVEMMPLPRLVKRWLFQGSLWLLQGPPSRYRMPDPDYAIDQAHPTMTDEIPRLVAHGKLTVKPDIASLDGSRVALQGRHGGGDRHHRVRHRLPARRPLHGREPDFRRRRQAAALSQRGPPRARRAVRGGSRAGQRQHVAAGRLSGPDDRQPHRRRAARAGTRPPVSRPAGRAGQKRARRRRRRLRAPPPGSELLRLPAAAEAADAPVRAGAEDEPRLEAVAANARGCPVPLAGRVARSAGWGSSSDCDLPATA